MNKRNCFCVATAAMMVLLGSGCVSYYSKAPVTSAPLADMETTATYDVIGDASATAKGATLFGFIPIGGENKYGQLGSVFSPNPVLRAAMYKAIEAVPEADSLLAPRYHIKTSNYIIYSEQTVTVKGKAIRYNLSTKE